MEEVDRSKIRSSRFMDWNLLEANSRILLGFLCVFNTMFPDSLLGN